MLRATSIVFRNCWDHFAPGNKMRTRQQTELYIKMEIFKWVLRKHTNSFILQKTEDSAQGGQTFISIQSGTVVLKTSHLTFLICAFKKRGGMEKWRCLINCCLDKSRRGMVEDDADDRSIMPQRRLEKPTIERWSCHSILQKAPHQRVSLCH